MLMEMGILLFVFSMIVFAIIRQTKKMISTKKRQVLAQHYKRIAETEMVLKCATSLAFNSRLIILLHERIISSLKAILAVEPKQEKIKLHISQHYNLISTAKVTSATGPFVEPADERIAIDLARSISSLKIILRSELNNNNISLEDCNAEEAKLEKIRLKLRISNCLIKATVFFERESYHISIKMLNDNIALMEAVDIKDEFLIEKHEQMIILLNKSTYQLAELEAKNKRLEQLEQPEATSTLDTLFDQKQR
ncbi:hypothetical protein FR932_08635 [Moritella marina ATCC 15381]|uniref:DNA repair protein n=2 Tax=Moritella marina TaxID=90736 RepID=A0A5J6WQ12_MORMI|nr:hypothetical protein [Moritella marina]QFI40243.1 hypothetical protein FR932_08635 [Moritella marina ATCC 15381]